ncbi:MAG: hypothetical protein FJ109_18075, partial [Deltaproteobacteria bacterium]|nr:hypothetical protein [Deltaproteobacteria bacterium]
MLRVAPVICLLLICLAALPAAAGPSAAVRIIEGPTPVPNGKCRGSHDLTMINDRVAFSFAIDTERPWGNPAGAILDGGLVADGEVGKDRLSFVDFLPDGWNPWPHVRHEIRIVEDGPERAVLRVTRDFRGNPLVTTWTLHAGASELHVETRLENKSGKPLKGLLSGYSFCTKDGNTFVVEEPTTAERPATGGADWLAAVPTRADWAAGYGPDWAGGLLFPGADRVAGGRSWKDLYRATDVEPGGEARLTAVYRLSSGAGISDLPVALARSNGRGVARLSGTVRTSAGDPVSDSYILFASPEGAVMGWAAGDTGQSSRSKSPGRTQGTFSFELPEGRWQVQALATDHRSPPAREVVVTSGQELTVDFDGLEPPGTVRLHVRMAGPDAATSGPDATGASVETGAHGPLSERGSVDASSEKATERLPAPPLVGVDARIVRVGTPPPVRHAERFVTYTSLQDRGEASFPCPPGEHEFLVSHGGGFLAPFERVRLVVEPGKTAVATVLIPRQESPRDRGWYCADLHHHSDHADGTTSPEQLVLSQSAAGLDYFYVSDHG